MQNLLSDEELMEAWRLSYGGGPLVVDGLRAVQSAVLAKAEVEAREMQREAFGVGWYHGKFGENVDPVRDAKYPSLRPPKTVTLSTGEWRRDADGYWLRGQSRHIAAEVATLDDAEKLAAYLRAEGK